MKKLLLSFSALLLFAGITFQTQASQQNMLIDDCELAYQVAFSRAFQSSYLESGDIDKAETAGVHAGIAAWLDCEMIF